MKDKSNNHFHKKAMLDRLSRVWNQMPDLTLGQLISICNLNRIEKLSDEEIIQTIKQHIRVYKEERSLKNKLKKGLKSCVTKLTLW